MKHRRSDAIDWLVNQAPAHLGERGINQDPSAGGGQRTVADTSAYHDAMIRAIPHVERERKLNRVWKRLTIWEQAVLEQRYRPRQHVSVFGATVAFGELAGLALWLAPDQRRLCSALANIQKPENEPIVAAALAAAVAANDRAHDAFERLQRSFDLEWAEGSEA